MPVDPNYYPPFDPRELPANPTPRMEKVLQALYRASVELHRTLYRLTLLHEITRNPEFVGLVNGTLLVYPMLTIRSGLAYSVAVSLSALFQVQDTTASLRRVLNTLTDRREESSLLSMHVSTDIDAEKAIARLRRLKKRLNGPTIGNAINRLDRLRNQELAHFDLDPKSDEGKPQMADFDMIFIFAANVVNTATVTAAKRLLKTRESYDDARQQARDFTAALIGSPTKEP